MVSIWDILTKTWEWDASVIIGCISLLVCYMVWQDFRPRQRWVWFILGDLFLLIALVSPLHTLGDTYLFSAHMVQHLLLMLFVPPLLLVSLPPKRLRKALEKPFLFRAERYLSLPLVALLAGIGTMWFWHIPALYQATLDNHNVHIVEHLSFLVTSTIFWWPVLTPLRERQLTTLPAMVYLFTAGFASLILGILLTFAPPLYAGYQNPHDWLGLLPTIRQGWRVSAALDQQVGGLIMWVASGPIYLAAILWVLSNWFSSQDEAARDEAWAQEMALKTHDADSDTDKAEEKALVQATERERAVTLREELL